MAQNPTLYPESLGELQAYDAFSPRIDRLRLRHLRLLNKVSQMGSLSAAAQAIGMSQPGATKAVQELEQAFGCLLIERSAKGGHLSEAGTRVLERLRIALHAIGTARQALETDKERPLVRLGIIPLIGISALGHVVQAMQADSNAPRLRILQGTADGLLMALSEGSLDCVVGLLDETTSFSEVSKFNMTPLWEEHLVVVAAHDHPLVKRKKVTLEMTRQCDWVLMPKSSLNRRTLDRLFLQAGLAPPEPTIETESFMVSLSLLDGSRMLAALPESAYRHFPSRASLLRMEAKFPSAKLVFVTLADIPTLPSIERLRQQFLAHAAQPQSA